MASNEQMIEDAAREEGNASGLDPIMLGELKSRLTVWNNAGTLEVRGKSGQPVADVFAAMREEMPVRFGPTPQQQSGEDKLRTVVMNGKRPISKLGFARQAQANAAKGKPGHVNPKRESLPTTPTLRKSKATATSKGDGGSGKSTPLANPLSKMIAARTQQ